MIRSSQRRLLLFLTLSIAISTSAQVGKPNLVDVHVHYNGEPGVLEKLLVKLEAVNGMAFLLTTPAGLPTASKFIKENPTRFVGFGDVKLDDPNVLDEIDRFHEAGFRGLGEITSTLKNYDDRSYWPIYDRADKYHMLLLFHTGIVNRLHPEQSTDISFDRSRVTRLDLIARHWPNLTIVGAHMGNPDYAEAAEIGRWDPNLYFDLSGSTLLKKRNDYQFFQSIFWWTGVVSPHTPARSANAFEKLVFGSDVFNGELDEFDAALSRYHAMLSECAVPENSQEMIFSGTMWRILQEQEKQIAADKR